MLVAVVGEDEGVVWMCGGDECYAHFDDVLMESGGLMTRVRLDVDDRSAVCHIYIHQDHHADTADKGPDDHLMT